MISGEIDTTTVRLIGLGGIVDLWKQPRPTVYSKWARGKLTDPDWVVAVPAGKSLNDGVPVWLAGRFTDEPDVIDESVVANLPRLVGMDEIAVCMDVQRRTVEAMRSRGRQDVAAPEPYDRIGKTPVWWAAAWKDFARLTGRPFDLNRLIKLDRERRK